MTDSSILTRYAEIFENNFGGTVEKRANATTPWFCKDIQRKKALQWAGYLGECSRMNRTLAFGLNLEFTPAWRLVYPKLRSNLSELQSLLAGLDNAEWHWDGRPGFKVRNPPTERLEEPKPPPQVDVFSWLNELDQILNQQKLWNNGKRMRPQMQIMFVVGQPKFPLNEAQLVRDMGKAIKRLSPLITLFQ
ncbi:MAG: hypothetical protein HGA99_05280 [Chlorobiaceae bacterium]|nr:hypothetical protein [Chlorobiaceae bacterium]